MLIMSNFGERLSELISDNEVSIQNFANSLGVTIQAVYRWKTNKKDINLSTLFKIASYFNCSLEFLAGRTEDDIKINYKKRPSLFSDCIRAVMKEKNISTYALRKQTRFNNKYFQVWKNGADPKLSTLIELADYFNCTLDHLVGLE